MRNLCFAVFLAITSFSTFSFAECDKLGFEERFSEMNRKEVVNLLVSMAGKSKSDRKIKNRYWDVFEEGLSVEYNWRYRPKKIYFWGHYIALHSDNEELITFFGEDGHEVEIDLVNRCLDYQ